MCIWQFSTWESYQTIIWVNRVVFCAIVPTKLWDKYTGVQQALVHTNQTRIHKRSAWLSYVFNSVISSIGNWIVTREGIAHAQCIKITWHPDCFGQTALVRKSKHPKNFFDWENILHSFFLISKIIDIWLLDLSALVKRLGYWPKC